VTINKIKNILEMEIPLENIEVNCGIYEFYEENGKSIGISYENIDGRFVYIFNLFLNGEYINIAGAYESIYDAAEEIMKKWNEFKS